MKNKWSECKSLYDTIVAQAVQTKKVDYNNAMGAILADFHMVAVPVPIYMTEQSFIDIAYKIFPEGSECMKWARRFIGLKYFIRDKNEYILCMKRKDRIHKVWVPRCKAEYNPKYIQQVSMAIPFIMWNEEPIFVFVSEKLSDMSGHVTMIGGHVQYESGNDKLQDSQLILSARREAYEELGFTSEDKGSDFKYVNSIPTSKKPNSKNVLGDMDFDITTTVDKSCISYYHIGKGYPFEMNLSLLSDIHIEEGKELFLWSPEVWNPRDMTRTLTANHRDYCIHTGEIRDADPWLKMLTLSV